VRLSITTRVSLGRSVGNVQCVSVKDLSEFTLILCGSLKFWIIWCRAGAIVSELSSRGERSLRDFFESLVWRHFVEHAYLNEPRVTRYISDMLVAFANIDNLYRIRNAQGRRLEEVGEMLIESNPLLAAASFDREREVRKHVGDYTLFTPCVRKEERLGASPVGGRR
jgi:hypothetical protein